MPQQPLIKDTGKPFDSVYLESSRGDLDALTDQQRFDFRNANADAIAVHPATKILIVSGPGTGKSTIFKKRIKYWLQGSPDAKILALSFVRKLVADLNNDIQGDLGLTGDQKRLTEVRSLHQYARGIVERNHGTSEWRLGPHFRIIGPTWKDVVWGDVMLFAGQAGDGNRQKREFERQMHEDDFLTTDNWPALETAYFKLCGFYNAVGFGDLILRARDALSENPTLNQHDFFIIDEYQDFNAAEESLLKQLTGGARGLLVVGDDDQVLYEKLKSGNPTLIRDMYKDADYANAMLPYCGRSGYHIAKIAGHFIQQEAEADCIEKIYLPLTTDASAPKIQAVACATAGTALDYIEKFIEDHAAEIAERKEKLSSGEKKDAFLLILSPSKDLRFYATSNVNKKLVDLVARFSRVATKFSEDYYRVLSYYALANYPANNFTFRKVLHYEGVTADILGPMLRECISENTNFEQLSHAAIHTALTKCQEVKVIVDGQDLVDEKVRKLASLISIPNPTDLKRDLERHTINDGQAMSIEHTEEEQAEMDELEIKEMSVVELMTIVGSKGLSADHVIIVGFDNVNMTYLTKNAFYVAITRPRTSLHLITAMQSGGATGPNDFLNRLPEQHVEFSSYKKTGHKKTALADKSEFLRYFATLNFARRRGTGR